MSSVAERLAALPAKVRLPVQSLLSSKLIDEDAVVDALDAVELAGRPDRLAPFLTAVAFLRSQSVPVRDVIAMARANGRRIRLDWSPRRWQDEHGRLSRLETLKRLSSAKVRYDLSQYETALPVSFPGYLIRTSRRLGMEGLRQRHCVASYHDNIVRGHSAVAVVFVDGRRWTVQLSLTGRSDAPLRILQVATAGNVRPTREQLERVHGVLAVPLEREVPPDSAVSEIVRERYLRTLRAVLPVLREHGVEQVKVLFDGSGDSGSIDAAIFTPSVDAERIEVLVPVTEVELGRDGFEQRQPERRVPLSDAIDNVAEAYIDQAPVNWYDNDGGFGELVIDVASGTVSLEVNVRLTESSCEFSRVLSIDNGEVVD